MDVGKPKSFEAITREKFLEYAMRRRELDSEYGKSFNLKYQAEEAMYEMSKAKKREEYEERLENEEGFREKMREKSKAQAERRKKEKEVVVPEYKEQPRNFLFERRHTKLAGFV